MSNYTNYCVHLSAFKTFYIMSHLRPSIPPMTPNNDKVNNQILIFQDEHQKIMRALHDSIERESNLNCQIRRMKESLVATALRLQIATKLSAEDESTISILRKEAAEAKKNELIAKNRSIEALELINSLKMEITSLKRKLKTESQNIADQNAININTTTNTLNKNNLSSTTQLQTNMNGLNIPINHYQSSKDNLLKSNHLQYNECDINNHITTHGIFDKADREVDMLFMTEAKVSLPPNVGGEPYRSTPFQQWKMQKFLYTSDTPNGSIYHDKHSVDMLAEMSTRESLLNMSRGSIGGLGGFDELGGKSYIRPIKSSIAKRKANPPMNTKSLDSSLHDLSSQLAPLMTLSKSANTLNVPLNKIHI